MDGKGKEEEPRWEERDETMKKMAWKKRSQVRVWKEKTNK